MLARVFLRVRISVLLRHVVSSFQLLQSSQAEACECKAESGERGSFGVRETQLLALSAEQREALVLAFYAAHNPSKPPGNGPRTMHSRLHAAPCPGCCLQTS